MSDISSDGIDSLESKKTTKRKKESFSHLLLDQSKEHDDTILKRNKESRDCIILEDHTQHENEKNIQKKNDKASTDTEPDIILTPQEIENLRQACGEILELASESGYFDKPEKEIKPMKKTNYVNLRKMKHNDKEFK